MRILVHSISGTNLSIRVWTVIGLRPTTALRSVKEDRNGVSVVKKEQKRRSYAEKILLVYDSK